MPTEHPATNGAPKSVTPPRSTDEHGRPSPITDEKLRALIEEENRRLDDLAGTTDATDPVTSPSTEGP